MTALLLHGGVDASGARVDVRCDDASGTVLAVAAALAPVADEHSIDCTGMVLLPAPAEPHAHLDKALSADRAPNPAGDLAGAIAAWHAYRPRLTASDIEARGRAAIESLIAHGATAVRTHVDVGPGIGLRGLHALVALREQLRAEGLVELQLVALVTPPLSGAQGAAMRALVADALAAGADVVGGAPHLDPDPAAATAAALELAITHGVPLDLHVDETLDPDALWLEDLIALVEEQGPAGGVTASHCVSLGVQPAAVQARLAARAAAAGVAVVALPQSNLYLQARGRATAPPRGITAARALLDAGACLAAGGDNVRDPFNCLGRSDPLEAAALMVLAAHLTPAEAWECVSGAARRAMGLEPAALVPGAPAELLAVLGTSLTVALAQASEQRIVIHAGRCVAHTVVASQLLSLPSPVPVGATP